ncbi:Eco57I restriction-modification methylase domain-containing protein [Halanaerobium congolense]|jgi:hypothetical protein|uniref:site-specific DNA-methyltransferase (adenine-specific) n=1 Tax=Halanaerobium congolense TaxID=54121 RepID=A0A1G6IU37_9FIRM|nr:DNA methyltransferase [Halanaerobium congolense]SDC10092.1 Methyltransferase domain-containing protein [Halanaerobium congolense]
MDTYINKYLFSEAYIDDKIIDLKNKNKVDDKTSRIFYSTKEWLEPFIEGDMDAEYWIEDFIDIILNTVLGFTSIDNNNIRILKEDELAKKSTVAYVLDKHKDIDSNTKGKFYAYEAVKKAKNEGLNWAILTNGYKWRLYNTNNISPYENYLEIDIEESLSKEEPDINFKLFINFFQKENFIYSSDNKNLNLDKMLEESNKRVDEIEDHLKEKAELILNDLCNGFKENMNFDLYTESDRREIYVDSIIYLYRLLFFGYSEARGLLPSNPNDKEYKKNSFEIICEEAKEILNTPGKIRDIVEQYDFWDRIDEYLRIHVDEHYDGGLFENDDKSVLKNYKINNKYLVKAIAEINYFKNDKGEYVNKINYKDLSVRNLGSIYEGLLEYNLFIAEEMLVKRVTSSKVKFVPASKTKVKNSDVKIKEGQVYISEDPTERKETGSYYTPEDVVEYIISNTVEKKILDLKEEFKKEIEDDLYDVEVEVNETIKNGLQKQIDNKILDFIEKKVLDLNIVDSAMGSGHFLVNTSYRIANLIIDILSENKWINEDLKLNVRYWRRRVVEECIYGIDINELAVYLSKLSLWLISATNDKPLSFIDHHLKAGNSIIGAYKKDIKLKMADEKATLFDVNEEKNWENNILPKYKKISELNSDTMQDIKKKQIIYSEVKKELELSKKKFDYYLAKKKEKTGLSNKFNEIMLSKNIKRFQKEDISSIFEIADKNKFFHWELEFPEVFSKGGFDISIGNPPYVNISSKDYGFLNLKTLKSRNLYSYMVEINLKNLNEYGVFGMVIPLSIVTSNRMSSLRDLITSASFNGNAQVKISNYAKRPSKIFPGVDQDISILFLIRESENSGLYTTKYLKWYSDERENLFNNLNFHKSNKKMASTYIPKIGNQANYKILKKLTKLSSKASKVIVNDENDSEKLYYHNVARYWIKAYNFMPRYEADGKQGISSGTGILNIKNNFNKNYLLSIINSSLFYWYWLTFSDGFHVTKTDIKSFPLPEKQNYDFENDIEKLMQDYKKNSETKEMNISGKKIIIESFNPKKSKKILDELDYKLGEEYGLTEEEIEYIINYDIEFRM